MTKKTTEQTFELKYTGTLSNADGVFLHYGYSNWENVSESKMKKLKSGCKTEITLPSDAELNFCFRNESGDWDNNYGQNYFFTPSIESNYSFIEVKEKKTKVSKTESKKVISTTVSTKKTAASKTTPTTIKPKVAAKTVTKKVK